MNPRSRARNSFLVATGVLASRLVGLVRQRVIAHYLGMQTDAADAWSAGFKIPNFLQNLFGDQALSASFIPVYASLLAGGDREEADRVAGAVGALLALLVAIVVLTCIAATPLFIDAIAPGFHGDKRDLTISLVRVLFPAVGLLVMSAWCLGILNSHHRFLLSYMAPVMFSLAIIATLLIFGPRTPSLPRLVLMLGWGSIAGAALQFAVQLPVVVRVAPQLRFTIDTTTVHVRTVLRNFTPVLVSRGVVQLSGYIDTMLATLLPTGAAAGLLNAQTLYTLPVSLFGMSVSAVELPAMSGAVDAGGNTDEQLRLRLDSGLRQIALFVVPSAMAFIALGDVVTAAVLQSGRFSHDDAMKVWAMLAGSSVGLLASTLGRLYSSTYYALRDTRTPLKYAVVRVMLTTALGYLCAFPLPRALGIAPIWGTAGLTASAGVAGWVEMLLLRSTLNERIGRTGLRAAYVAKLWVASAVGAAAAWGVKLAAPPLHPVVAAVAILGPYGVIFFAMTFALRIPEASTALARLRRR